VRLPTLHRPTGGLEHNHRLVPPLRERNVRQSSPHLTLGIHLKLNYNMSVHNKSDVLVGPALEQLRYDLVELVGLISGPVSLIHLLEFTGT
jgi:hypothetical protein